MERINKKTVLAILVSCILILGTAWFIFFVQLPKIKETSDAIQKEKLDSFVRLQKSDKIYKLKKDLPDIEEQRNEMERELIDKNDSVPFFRTLEKIAADAGCQLKVNPADLNKVKFDTSKQASAAEDDETDPAPAKKVALTNEQIAANEAAKTDELSKIKTYPAFTIAVTGKFASDVSFLSELENIPYFVRVLTLGLSPIKIKTSSGSSTAGTLAAGGQTAGNDTEQNENMVNLDLLVIVYSNDKK